MSYLKHIFYLYQTMQSIVFIIKILISISYQRLCTINITHSILFCIVYFQRKIIISLNNYTERLYDYNFYLTNHMYKDSSFDC